MGDRVWLSVVLTSGLVFHGKGQPSLVGGTLVGAGGGSKFLLKNLS